MTLLVSQIAYGYWYLDQIAVQTEIKIAELSRVQTSEKNSQLEQIRILLRQANDEVERYKSNSAQAEESIAQEKLKLDEITKKASDAESRARWLSKENRKFQGKIKALSDELSSIKKTIAANPPPKIKLPELIEHEAPTEQIN